MDTSDPDKSGNPASDFDIIGSVMKQAEATRHAPPPATTQSVFL